VHRGTGWPPHLPSGRLTCIPAGDWLTRLPSQPCRDVPRNAVTSVGFLWGRHRNSGLVGILWDGKRHRPWARCTHITANTRAGYRGGFARLGVRRPPRIFAVLSLVSHVSGCGFCYPGWMGVCRAADRALGCSCREPAESPDGGRGLCAAVAAARTRRPGLVPAVALTSGFLEPAGFPGELGGGFE
jgi:hypothetical protein